MLPFVVSLQISTLYLRQHYFVDIPAGWALAGLCLLAAPRLGRAWSWLDRDGRGASQRQVAPSLTAR
jgi:membrane-associated phospholipid phosphatase